MATREDALLFSEGMLWQMKRDNIAWFWSQVAQAVAVAWGVRDNKWPMAEWVHYARYVNGQEE